MSAPAEPLAEDLQTALASVAQAIAESLELKQVWDRVAAACRAVVPFDAMGVSLLQSGNRVQVHVASAEKDADRDDLWRELPFSRDDFSPGLWPPGDYPFVLLRDTEREVDPAFLADRELVELGLRSVLRLPLGRGGEVFGSLILVAREAGRFTEDHALRLGLVAELVTLSLAHERLVGASRNRRQRKDAVERLIPALTGTLDVREVFDQISKIAQEIVPHDFLSLGLLTPDLKVRIIARLGTQGDALEMPEYTPSEGEIETISWDYFLAREHSVLGPNQVRAHLVQRDPSRPAWVDMELDDAWMRGYTDLGVRSAIRAPIRLDGVVVGGLGFMARRPDSYDDEDAEFAIRVAEHVALALSHQRLAEESRRGTAAQHRATHLEERVHLLAQELESLSPHRALGRSLKWKDVLAQATKVAPTDTTVLITGESGTGKEVVARFVHRGSPRKDGPFVALNCAALPEQLLESELFGHEKGAFTGALSARPGRIEQASRGVLFLDEVGEMSPAVQAKFLRVLQEREYQRVGGTRTLKADVRVLAATNRNLKAAIAQGGFREDLYYRLAVFDIGLPPLRERPEDVLVLAEAFLEEIGKTVGRPAAGLSEEVKGTLVAYPWPGNVRELRNALERAVILCEGGLITSEHLPVGVAAARETTRAPSPPPPSPAPSSPPPPGASTLDAAERDMIVKALAKAGNNKSKAARLLGLTRAQLRSRIEKHGLVLED